MGKRDPERHQLDVLPPLEEQPMLIEDSNRATAQNNANFFMICLLKRGGALLLDFQGLPNLYCRQGYFTL